MSGVGWSASSYDHLALPHRAAASAARQTDPLQPRQLRRRTMVKTPPANKGKQIIKVGALSYAQLIKFMLEGVYSCEELLA